MTTTGWGEKVKRVERLARSFQQRPLASAYKPRLCRPWQPASIWKLFPRQSAALAFAKGCKEDVHLFALEKEQAKAGQRIYLVSSYPELWHYYRMNGHSLMHCYEVIPEGAVCKLYFDLEFHKPSNEGLNGPQMVLLLTQYVCQKLGELYGISCSTKDVLNLDSSTEDKFSRHLVFILPNAAFKDNGHVGRFVHKILQPVLETLKEERRVSKENATRARPDQATDLDRPGNPRPKRWKPGEEEPHFLLVKNIEGQPDLFVDLGVYTKNRNFRLYKSSKAGKNAAFTVAEDNCFVPQPDKLVSTEEAIFLASLVTNVSFTGQTILISEISDRKDAQTPLIPSALPPSCISDPVGGSQHSPYKEVDEFVCSLVRKDGVQGAAVRRWSYFEPEQLLVYDILRYRWCGNIGRFHRSNNIMILVDLKEEVWYQKCHDPVCRSQNYRSPSYPLPQDICVSYLLKEFLLNLASVPPWSCKLAKKSLSRQVPEALVIHIMHGRTMRTWNISWMTRGISSPAEDGKRAAPPVQSVHHRRSLRAGSPGWMTRPTWKLWRRWRGRPRRRCLMSPCSSPWRSMSLPQ